MAADPKTKGWAEALGLVGLILLEIIRYLAWRLKNDRLGKNCRDHSAPRFSRGRESNP